MRTLIVFIFVLCSTSAASAETAAESSELLSAEQLIEALGSRIVNLTETQRELLASASDDAEARKRLDKPTLPFQEIIGHLNPKDETITRSFAEHEDPVLRFFVFFNSAKLGSKDSAKQLHALFRLQCAANDAAIIRTSACLRGIRPESDSPEDLADLLTYYGKKDPKLVDGQSIHDFQVTDSDGNIVSRSTLKGSPTYVYFWATWCGSCMASMDKTVKLVKTFPKNVRVLFVNIDLDEKTFQQAIGKIKLDCQHIHDAERILSRTVGVKGVPHHVWLDSNGKLTSAKAILGSEQPVKPKPRIADKNTSTNPG